MKNRPWFPDVRRTVLTGFHFTGRLPRYIVGLPYKILRKPPCFFRRDPGKIRIYRGKKSGFHLHFELRERDLDTLFLKAAGDPRIDRVLDFVGNIIGPGPDIDHEF